VSILLLVEASAVKEVRFASPLESLTIPDPELLETVSSEDGQAALATRRRRFLPRFRFGLEVENVVRQKLALGELSVDDDDDDAVEVGGKDWVGKTKAAEERRRQKMAALIEKGYDSAMSKYDSALAKSKLPTKKNPNKYQIVGLLDKNNPKKPIQWHARPKPEGAKWSVRLVHLNKDVIVKDLFDQGKIDIFAKYTNTGKMQTKGEGDSVEQTNIPIVTREYEARERSWKNLFNFSPKHFFTDSSGAYWRERRLRPGMYTDGETVYEGTYRYRDGRNGMHKVSTLKQFLASKSVDTKEKEHIMKKLKSSAPDVVLEL
jgi:hypothetical protein